MAEETHIKLAHGGGGQLAQELTEQVVLPALGGTQEPGRLTDAAELDVAGRLAFTTDSHVIQPLEFPGGDIGKLAICGTVNDLAVSGAVAKALSVSLILEEGLDVELLRRVVVSAGMAARSAGVQVVTGDTKVVERGGLAGMMINSAGIGEIPAGRELGFDRIVEGDRIVLSGPLGEHAMAVMSARENLSFTNELVSDCGSINDMTESLLNRLGKDVHFMRDPTRGGLAATLNEVCSAIGRDMEIQQEAIPINPSARAIAEMLGLDLVSAANEGKLVAIVAESAAEEAVSVLAECKSAKRPAAIGRIAMKNDQPLVEMVTTIGGRRIVQMPYGEQLPRIC